MKKIYVTASCFIIFSCFKTDIVQFEKKNKLAPRDASGLQYGGIGGMTDTAIICNPAGLGRKFCRFLRKYDYTFWAEDNYSKQVFLRDKATKLRKYLYGFIVLFLITVNIPIVRYSYFEWSNKSSIKKLSQDLELILSSNRMLGDLMFLKIM